MHKKHKQHGDLQLARGRYWSARTAPYLPARVKQKTTYKPAAPNTCIAWARRYLLSDAHNTFERTISCKLKATAWTLLPPRNYTPGPDTKWCID